MYGVYLAIRNVNADSLDNNNYIQKLQEDKINIYVAIHDYSMLPRQPATQGQKNNMYIYIDKYEMRYAAWILKIIQEYTTRANSERKWRASWKTKIWWALNLSLSHFQTHTQTHPRPHWTWELSPSTEITLELK